MPMPHRLSSNATADLRRLYRRSVLDFGIAQADRYLARLDAAFTGIAEFPNAYPARPEIAQARIRPFEAHNIVYRIRGNEVLILRVLHGRQDLAKYLNG